MRMLLLIKMFLTLVFLAIVFLSPCSRLFAADFDRDGDVDSYDLLQVVDGTQKGLRGFSNGDANRDGRINEEDIRVVQDAWTGVTSPQPRIVPKPGGPRVDSGYPDLIYNPFSGDVMLDVSDLGSDHTLHSFVLGNHDGSFRLDQYVPAFIELGTGSTASDEEIWQGNPLAKRFGNRFEQPTTSIGNLFPVGIPSPESLRDYLAKNSFVDSRGVAGAFDLFVCADESCEQTVGGRVDSRDVALPPTFDSFNPNLVYNAEDGEVWLQAGRHGRAIDGFVLSTEQSDFRIENLNLPFADDGTNSDATASQIGQVDVLQARTLNSWHRLGQIAPTGMSNVEAFGYFAVADFISNGLRGRFDFSTCETSICSEFLPNADVDLDGDVDVLDSILVEGQLGDFVVGSPLDVDRSQHITTTDVRLVRENFTGVHSAPSVGGAGGFGRDRLIYNPFTGDVTIDPWFSEISGFVIATVEGDMQIEKYLPPESNESALRDSTAIQIGIHQTEPLITERTSLGEIFPRQAASNVEELRDYLSVASFVEVVEPPRFSPNETRKGGVFSLQVCQTHSCVDIFDSRSLDFEDSDNADLIYNPFTGNVLLQPSDVEPIVAIRLGVDDESLLPENANLPFLDNGENTTVSSSAIFQTASANESLVQPHDLGNILPLGMISPRDVAGIMSEFRYRDADFQIKTFDLFSCTDPDCNDSVGGIVGVRPSLFDTENADLIYNPFTGNVTLDASDTNSGKIIAYVISNGTGSFQLDAWNRQFLNVGGDDEHAWSIGEVDPFNGAFIERPIVDLGDFFPTGMQSPSELAAFLTNAHYASGLGVGGFFDLFVCGDAACTFLSADGTVNFFDDADADLIYDPSTGNVKLDARDTDSQNIISFDLISDRPEMRTQNFMKPFLDVGHGTDDSSFRINQTDSLNGAIPTDIPIIDIGDIFPAGMSRAELADYLTAASYASAIGAGGTFDLVYVPESTSGAMLLVGLLLLTTKNSRKRNHSRQ